MIKEHLNNVERVRDELKEFNKLRLHASERNKRFSDEMFAKYKESIQQEDILFYPNLHSLYKRLSDYFHIDKDCIIMGDGSDRIIKYVFETYGDEYTNIISTDFCFPMYKVYCDLYNCNFREVLYTDKLTVDIEGIVDTVDQLCSQKNIVMLSNPNSPVGDLITMDKMIFLLEKCSEFGTLVVIDEAYIDFCEDHTVINLVNEYDNLIVIRTFSKGWGSAGVRFGIAASNKKIIQEMFKFRTMHEITGLTYKWIHLLLDHPYETKVYTKQVVGAKKVLVRFLKTYGLDVVDGHCNWIHLNNKEDNLQFDDKDILMKSGCSLPHDSRTNWYRISIQHHIDTLLEVIK